MMATLQRCGAASVQRTATVQRSTTAVSQPARGGGAQLSEQIEKSQSRAPAMVQAKYSISPAGDRHEREADSAADSAASGRSVPQLSPVAPYTQRSPSTPAAPARAASRDPVGNVLARPPPGRQLDSSIRGRLEHSFGADLGGVRVHTGPEAAVAAAHINARAFASGNHIWLGAGESPGDTRLMAHEVAHTVQQGAVARTPAAGPTGTSPPQRTVQRSEGGFFSMDTVWSVVRRVAPSFEPVVREISQKGIFGFLKGKLGGAMRGLFGGMRNEGGGLAAFTDTFSRLGAVGGEIVAGLSNGCCEPLFAAVGKMKDAVSDLAGRAWDTVANAFRPIGVFLGGVWDKFNSGVIGPIAEMLGDAWTRIKNLGRTIWGYVSSIKDAAFVLSGQVWDWIKGALGISPSSGESEGGLVSWISDKISAVWTEIKAELEPVLAPIRRAVEFIRGLLPLEAIQRLRERVQSWLRRVSQMASAMEADEGVVQSRTSLRETILPAIIQSIGGLKTRITEAGAWVSEKIGGVAESVGGMLASMGRNTWLSWAQGALGWLSDNVAMLAEFAGGAVRRVFGWVTDALAALQRWIVPIFDTLVELAGVLSDIAGRVGNFVTGRLFGWIPACIRKPIKDFIVNKILRNIPVFSQLMDVPNLWERVSRTALDILKEIFVHGNLGKAAWKFFSAVLNLLGIPAKLVLSILNKAASAIGDILSNPIGFLINVLKTMKRGFERFFDNFRTNVEAGVMGWLFGQFEGTGITIPREFSLRSILGFVMEILGITVEKVIQKIERQAGERVGQRLRQMVRMATGVWRFAAVLIEEGPAGLWREVQESLGNLFETLKNAAINWITTTIISKVSFTVISMFASGGIMVVVNAIIALWAAIETAAQYARQILEMVDRMLDGVTQIAQGVIEPPAAIFERALVTGLTVAIGFLANFLRLGNIGQRVRGIVEDFRIRVDRALDSLIARAIRTGRAFLAMLKRGARAVTDWLGLTSPVRLDNTPHTLKIEGSSARKRPVFHSTPISVKDWTTKKLNGDPAWVPPIVKAAGAEVPIVNLIRTHAIALETEMAKPPATVNATTVQTHFDAVVGQLTNLNALAPPAAGTAIPTNIHYMGLAGAGFGGGTQRFGIGMRAEPLGPTRPTGSGVHQSRRDDLRAVIGSRQSEYRIGHLLNHHLGGPGDNWLNLTPISQSTNSTHLHRVESILKTHIITNGRYANYTVRADYPSSARPAPSPVPVGFHPAEQFFAAQITCEFELLERDPANPGRLKHATTLPSGVASATPPPVVVLNSFPG